MHHYRVKLRQNMTRGFQVICNFIVDKNAKIAVKAKGQGIVSPKSNNNNHHHRTLIYSALILQTEVTVIGALRSHPYRQQTQKAKLSSNPFYVPPQYTSVPSYIKFYVYNRNYDDTDDSVIHLCL